MIEPDVFELTKLAALAIGFEYEVEGEVGYIKANGDGPKIMVFNPANDVVDSLMLEQTLRINIQWESDGVRASFAPSDGQRQDFFQYFSPYSDFQGDRKKAKMYAVLQCAAQYGSSKVKEVPDNHISLLSTCRNYLQSTGQAYPRSSCRQCGSVLTANWKCPNGF